MLVNNSYSWGDIKDRMISVNFGDNNASWKTSINTKLPYAKRTSSQLTSLLKIKISFMHSGISFPIHSMATSSLSMLIIIKIRPIWIESSFSFFELFQNFPRFLTTDELQRKIEIIWKKSLYSISESNNRASLLKLKEMSIRSA